MLLNFNHVYGVPAPLHLFRTVADLFDQDDARKPVIQIPQVCRRDPTLKVQLTVPTRRPSSKKKEPRKQASERASERGREREREGSSTCQHVCAVSEASAVRHHPKVRPCARGRFGVAVARTYQMPINVTQHYDSSLSHTTMTHHVRIKCLVCLHLELSDPFRWHCAVIDRRVVRIGPRRSVRVPVSIVIAQ